MIEIPLSLIITGLLTWLSNKAVPAAFAHHNAVVQQHYEAAKDLCDNHNDCEAYKLYTLQGLKEFKRPWIMTRIMDKDHDSQGKK